MELQKRTELAATSVQTRNKKLTQVLQNSEYFVKSFQLLRNELGSSEKSFHQPAEEEMVKPDLYFTLLHLRMLHLVFDCLFHEGGLNGFPLR